MSNRAVTLVEERSRAKGSNLGVLRAIADYAKDNGRHGFPSIPTLAWKNRLTKRAAELIVRKLVQDGEIAPEWDRVNRRLYLNIRCICDWDTYQAEGPIPERENISRSTSQRFALSLVETASRRDGNLSSRHTPSENEPVEKSSTNGLAETSSTQPLRTVQEPCTEPVREPSVSSPTFGHRRHAFCSPDGFCVPEFLHNDFNAQLGSHAGDFDLLFWYIETDLRRRTERPTVLDPLNWWRDQLRLEIIRRGWASTGRPRPAASAPISREPWDCPHVDRCSNRIQCDNATFLNRPRRAS